MSLEVAELAGVFLQPLTGSHMATSRAKRGLAVGEAVGFALRASLRGALEGGVVAVPLAGVLFLIIRGMDLPSALALMIWIGSMGVTAAVGVIEGSPSVKELREQYPEVVEEGDRAALWTLLWSTPATVLFVWATAGYGLGKAAVGACVLWWVWVGAALAVSRLRGVRKARWMRHHHLAAAGRALTKWAVLRRDFEQALETRFGPLPLEMHVQLDSWTEERLMEASRALPQARSLADLGLKE
jgi:hypothetical protein